MVQSNHGWQNQYDESERENITAHLIHQPYVSGADMYQVVHQALHYWRYASISKQNNADVFMSHQRQLAVCGDWQGEGRVESAYVSAMRLLMRCHFIQGKIMTKVVIHWFRQDCRLADNPGFYGSAQAGSAPHFIDDVNPGVMISVRRGCGCTTLYPSSIVSCLNILRGIVAIR